MRKASLMAALILMSMVVAGCGNSPDGDSGRLSNVSSLPPL